MLDFADADLFRCHAITRLISLPLPEMLLRRHTIFSRRCFFSLLPILRHDTS